MSYRTRSQDIRGCCFILDLHVARVAVMIIIPEQQAVVGQWLHIRVNEGESATVDIVCSLIHVVTVYPGQFGHNGPYAKTLLVLYCTTTYLTQKGLGLLTPISQQSQTAITQACIIKAVRDACEASNDYRPNVTHTVTHTTNLNPNLDRGPRINIL
jgi:hypothetical protein